MKTCAREGCDRTFTPKRRNHIYCCPQCARMAANQRQTQGPKPEANCAVCGAAFEPKRRGHIYCSPACLETAWNDRRREARLQDQLFARHEKGGMVLPVQDVKEGEMAFYLADIHYPFEQKELLHAVEQAMWDFQPDRIYYLGDVFDCYGISSFDKNPSRLKRLRDEVDWVRGMLDRHHKMCPRAKRYWEDGNHEHRLTRYVWRHAGELYDLEDEDTGEPILSVPHLLKLAKRGIEYVPFPGRIDYAGFVVTHGPARYGANLKHCAKWMSERVRSSGISGHWHRNQSFSWVGDRGQSQSWLCVGCLCDLDPDYEPFADWQWGFAYSRIIDGKVHPTLVQPFGGKFQVEGRTYTY